MRTCLWSVDRGRSPAERTAIPRDCSPGNRGIGVASSPAVELCKTVASWMRACKWVDRGLLRSGAVAGEQPSAVDRHCGNQGRLVQKGATAGQPFRWTGFVHRASTSFRLFRSMVRRRFSLAMINSLRPVQQLWRTPQRGVKRFRPFSFRPSRLWGRPASRHTGITPLLWNLALATHWRNSRRAAPTDA